jgi:hypothetical protein
MACQEERSGILGVVELYSASLEGYFLYFVDNYVCKHVIIVQK